MARSGINFLSLLGGAGGGSSPSPTVSADGLTYTYPGFKPGTSASLVDVTAGSTLSTQNVDGTGKVTFVLASKPPAGNAIVIDGQQRVSAGTVAASSGGGNGGGGAQIADLAIFAGQSFMQAQGTVVAPGGPLASQQNPTGWTGPSSRFLILNGSALAQYQPYVNSDGSGGSTLAAWGYEGPFGIRYLADKPTNRTLVVAKHAIGSTGLAADATQNDWSPNTAGELYAALSAKVTAAKAAIAAAGMTLGTVKIYWAQGPQDARDTNKASAYQANLTELLARFRADFGVTRIGLERMHSEMTSTGFNFWKVVFDAQTAVARAAADVDVTCTDGAATYDGLHPTVDWVNIIGRRMYENTEGPWYAVAPYAGFVALADINNDRHAMPFTAGDLSTMKSVFPEDVLALTTTGTSQRFYVDNTGLLRNDLAANALRFTYENGKRQLLPQGAQQNAAVAGRDWTQAAWVIGGANGTTSATVALDQAANTFTAATCSSVTANVANATVLQTLATGAATIRAFSLFIKRLVGTGLIQITVDGGTTWATVAVTGTWARFSVVQSAILTPSFGVRIVTAGDKIAVDLAQCELNCVTAPVLTIGNAVTRPAENFLFSTAVNALLQGSAATYVVRGTGPVQSSATILGADAAGDTLLARNSGGQLVANSGGTLLNVNPGSGSFAGAWGVAGGYSPAGRRQSFNGSAVASDAAAAPAHGTVYPFSSSSRGTTSFGNAPIDFIAVRNDLCPDAQLQAIAVGN
ncbi:hypothetical protein ASF58_23205 [Methylobacterium sp. Leaf125]|uniref:sialate O-acetylesterase n=1 Tax=Methylobacterium sp. Leaf125 TaxID=1736265 RepID=UPI0006FABAFE|nr:sialate O-acetylesterase [Methylobacterium sp. Leaf125]KQQ39051.1 hypothetical protein ASF58_23205 [Methylobacterium sp. Leaf125]